MSDHFSVLQEIDEVVSWQKVWQKDDGNSRTDFFDSRNGFTAPHLVVCSWGADRIKLMPTVDPKSEFKARTVEPYGYSTVLVDDFSLTLDQARKLIDNLEAAIMHSVRVQEAQTDDNVIELFPADPAE